MRPARLKIRRNFGGFRRTTLITAGCLAALAGLGLSRKFSFDSGYWLLVFLPLLLLLRRKNIASLILVAVLGLAIGLWRGSAYMSHVHDIQELAGQRVILQVSAKTDSVYGNGSQLEFTAGGAKVIEPYSQDLAGSFRVSGFGVPMVYRGDRLEVSGKLYPSRGSNQARVSYAQLERIASDTSWLNGLTRKFAAGMYNVLPEPQASLGLGILIGQRSNLPDYTLLAMSVVGLTHIIAVSGYNLTIIVRGVSRVKRIFGSKFQRLIISLALIGTFILITGFSASIVRAALIAGLGLWAWYYGRQLRAVLALSLVAAVTGLVNPFYVWGDIGWYLSFLAFFGVLIMAPLVTKLLFKKREPRGLVQILFETLAAYVMTLPLIVFIFGKLSVVALAANLLVVPLVPFAMLFSAIAGIAGMVNPVFAAWLAIPAKLLLTYILDVAYWLSDLSFSQVLTELTTIQMITAYAIIGFFVMVLAARARRRVSKSL
jgi:competence protein ComEC